MGIIHHFLNEGAYGPLFNNVYEKYTKIKLTVKWVK